MKSRIVTIILAFLFGGFGIHRMYLGQVGIGFVYLIFCWTFIPCVIAIIDIILFAIMTNKKFDEKYNLQYLINKKQYENMR